MTWRGGESVRGSGLRLHAWIVRLVVVVNLALTALAFWPRFEGTADAPGLADKLWDDYRWDGFRVDFVWLGFSTLVIAVAFFFFRDEAASDVRARVDVYLCAAAFLLFLLWLYRGVATGVLDFG